MKKISTLLLCAITFLLSLNSNAQVVISEFHYDNTGADVNEQIEIFGPAGTDLTGWSIVLYNGTPASAVSYATLPLSGTIPNQCTIGGNNYGVVTVAAAGLQNGASDGMALVNGGGTALALISYEGVFTATNGPAIGLTSVDIGVSEDGTGTATGSIQRNSTGNSWTVAPAINTFGACNPGFAVLPISFKSFSAKKNSNTISLNWLAASTDNASYFAVEKSTNGNTYTTLTKVNALTGENNYSFTDNSAAAGNAFYRIKLVDADGSLKFSNVLRVKAGGKTFSLNSIYPTVVSSVVNLQISSDKKEIASLEIMDINGRLLQRQTLALSDGIATYPVNVSSLATGSYLVRITANEEILTGRFSKQ